MARVLKRTMFRRGRSTNDGIMSGIVDREQKSTGDLIGRARELTPELESLLREFTPKTRLPLGAVGAALVQGTPIRDALTTGYTDFTKRDDAREAAIRSGAVKLGIGQAMKEATPAKLIAAQREAKIMLPANATPAEIRAKAAELLEKKYTGVTYGDKASFRRSYELNKKDLFLFTYSNSVSSFRHRLL